MKRAFGAIVLLLALARLGAEGRSANIDLVLLVDTSLSMAEEIGEARDYLAEELLGPLLLPGDRLVLEAFYGKVDRIYAGTLRGPEDLAAILERVRGLGAEGRFTDIGSALDRAAADLAELGLPERPKYLLLATDERQEAPVGTKYYAPDYRLSHPALGYVKKLDFGAWRLITVGFDVGEKVEAAASAFSLLEEAPRRRGEDFPPLPEGIAPGLEGARELEAAREAAGGSPGEASAGQAGTGQEGPRRPRRAGGLLIPALAGGLVLAAGLGLALVLRAKRRREREEHEA